jgi:hypothetical protein
LLSASAKEVSSSSIDTLEIYDFGIWDFHVDWCERWSINFLTFYGHEILDHLDIIRSTSDERAISAKICEVTGRRTSSSSLA